MPKIMPCLWIDDRIEEMVRFYVDTFKDAEIRDVQHYPDGRVLTMNFRLKDQEFMALNGGDNFKFTEAVSFVVDCKDQAEVDFFWNTLTANGGEESMCGWLKDKYGLSWQIVPERLIDLIWDTRDKAASGRAQQAMFQMKKIIVADIEKAYAGG
ncbi:VOC family protein [Devosia sp. ZB163]|uniref:VOC family protein n=1 Tax=Devosia sp. ZB163 TaxID=3025938 RepID=UPI0023611C51|nr:VOC family protein [Devosia sp. ZB163]MDC9825483.1 VOC family protein [Devosia sp. ZB163]